MAAFSPGQRPVRFELAGSPSHAPVTRILYAERAIRHQIDFNA